MDDQKLCLSMITGGICDGVLLLENCRHICGLEQTPEEVKEKFV